MLSENNGHKCAPVPMQVCAAVGALPGVKVWGRSLALSQKRPLELSCLSCSGSPSGELLIWHASFSLNLNSGPGVAVCASLFFASAPPRRHIRKDMRHMHICTLASSSSSSSNIFDEDEDPAVESSCDTALPTHFSPYSPCCMITPSACEEPVSTLSCTRDAYRRKDSRGHRTCVTGQVEMNSGPA